MSKYTDWLARTGGARRSGLDKGFARNAHSPLAMMYPHRTVFHATEVAGLMSILAKYHILQKNPISASHAITVLQEVDPDHPTLAFAKDILAMAALQGAIQQVRSEAQVRNSRKSERRRDRRARKRR